MGNGDSRTIALACFCNNGTTWENKHKIQQLSLHVTVVRGVRPRSEIECKHHTRDALCLHSSCALSGGRATKTSRRVPPPLQSTLLARTYPRFFLFFCGVRCWRVLKAPVVIKLSAHTYPMPHCHALRHHKVGHDAGGPMPPSALRIKNCVVW